MFRRIIKYNAAFTLNILIVVAISAICVLVMLNSSESTGDAVSLPDVEEVVAESEVIGELREQVLPDGFTTVGGIKEKYGYGSNVQMRVNNVDQSQPFQIKFNANGIGKDAVAVYTNIQCNESSKMDINCDISNNRAGGTVVTISPKVGVLLSSEALNRKYSSDNCVCWGYAPVYYIRILYDVSSDTKELLKEPLIIPFTVRSETDTPLVSMDISNDGIVQLKWSKVKNADKYRIYYVDNSTYATSDKSGFSGCFPYLIGEVDKDTVTWSNWLGNENGISNSIKVDSDYVAEQNSGLKGEWFVTAVYKDNESNFSNSINFNKIAGAVPNKVASLELDISKKVKGVNKLPGLVNVVNMDGSYTVKEVDYTVDKSNIYDWRAYYKYKVAGTKLRGILAVDLQKGDEVKSSIKNSRTVYTDNKVAENKSIITSGTDTESIITADMLTGYRLVKECYSVSGASITQIPEIKLTKQYIFKNIPINNSSVNKDELKSDNYIMAGLVNTAEIVSYGDLEIIKANNDGSINASSAIEEYLGICISNRYKEISLKAFPEYQDSIRLQEVMENMQNVVDEAMDIVSYEYDCSKLMLNIRYGHSDSDYGIRSSAVNNKIKQVINKVKGIKQEYKRVEWIYKYMEENVKLYTTDTHKKGNDGINDPYGAIVLGKASSLGNARAFKLLCNNAGIECKIINGLYDGYRKHTWNIVKYGDSWYNVDCTNNKRNSNIGYTILNNGVNQKYVQDTEIISASNGYSYYTKNGLAASDKDSFWGIVTKALKNKKKEVVIRYDGKDANTDIIAYATTYLKRNKKAYKIKNFKLGHYSEYYIVSI